jgi:hypothetical protein
VQGVKRKIEREREREKRESEREREEERERESKRGSTKPGAIRKSTRVSVAQNYTKP